MSGEPWIGTLCGDGKLSGDGGAEYPCVRRYRHRRLLTFLWLQGFEATHGSMVSESDAIMWVLHLKQLVLRDQWQDARRYLYRFLRHPTSVEAVVLSLVLNAFNTLANIVVAGGEETDFSKQYLDHKRTMCHAQIRLRSIILNVQQARASIDWERVKEKAAEILDELAYATPELKDLTFMPRGPMKPHNVLPVGFGFRRRCRPKKQTRKPKSPAGVAKSYLVRWRRLPASSDPSQEKHDKRVTLVKALDRMADILDECLKAGKLEVHPLQTTGTEVTGTTAAPALQTISSSLTCPAIYTGIPSVANAGKLASHVPPTGAPFLQAVFSNLTSGSGNSGVGLMANAGAITAPLSQTMFGSLAGPVINPMVTSVEKAGARAAPLVSRNVHVTPGMPLVNAGKSACHALTPGAQISSTVAGCLTRPAKNSELPLMTKAESGHQGLNLRKNPKEETTSSDEQDHLKRQRATGAFSHAGLMPATAIET